MTEEQGKYSIAPTSSKRGYNKNELVHPTPLKLEMDLPNQ